VEILGVIGPNGATGSSYGPNTGWEIGFELAVWRITAASIQPHPLYVRRKIPREDLAGFQAMIKPYSVVRLRARVATDSQFNRPEGLLEAFIGVDDSDGELANFATELQKPVIHHDPEFGTFTLDRRTNHFLGTATWLGFPVRLDVLAEAAGDLEAGLRTAHSLCQSQIGWDKRVRDLIARELLPLKNDTWLAKDETRLTPDYFTQRITLDSISIWGEGSFDFWHNDGDMFGGHAIRTQGDLTAGPTHTGLEG
jgi:hypothetical protein